MKKIAFVFPGQGSQSVGMLKELAAKYPQVQKTFAEASEFFGQDLWQLAENGPEAKLNQTEITQPALLVAGVAVWRVWCEQTDVRPDIMAGHSLGEYTALHCAGTFGFREAVQLVSQRARLMQQAVPEGQGAMAAIIGLENNKIEEICKANSSGEVVAPVNFNAKGQTVIAGDKSAVMRVIKQAKLAGAKIAKLLPVSVPSHCALMQPVVEPLMLALNNTLFRVPHIPVLHNADVAVHTDQVEIKQVLAQQLTVPVRWVQTIEAFVNQDVELVIECGPGNVLTGLIKRINRQLPVISMNSPAGVEQALDSIGLKIEE